MWRSLSIGLLTLITLAGCVTPPPPPPQAVLSFADIRCEPELSLALAKPLVPEKPKKAYSVATEVTRTAPCLTLETGEKATYALFRLPPQADQMVLIAGGVLEPARIFAADVSLLDSDGKKTRGFGRDEHLYRGVLYSVEFRPRRNERYVLVQADPTLVGEYYDSVTLDIDSNMYCTGAFCSTTYAGVDVETTRQFSYVGIAKVDVRDLRKN